MEKKFNMLNFVKCELHVWFLFLIVYFYMQDVPHFLKKCIAL